jgi:hypothetical protein
MDASFPHRKFEATQIRPGLTMLRLDLGRSVQPRDEYLKAASLTHPSSFSPSRQAGRVESIDKNIGRTSLKAQGVMTYEIKDIEIGDSIETA